MPRGALQRGQERRSDRRPAGFSVDAAHGALFPVLSVAVVFSEIPEDGDVAPFVCLSSTESGADLDLRVPEARELIRLLQEAVDLIG